MNKKYFMVDNKPHKVLGIKGDRVILQCMTPRAFNTVRNRSFKIKFNGDIGYYIDIPQENYRVQISIGDILKQWDIYNNIKEYNKIIKEY